MGRPSGPDQRAAFVNHRIGPRVVVAEDDEDMRQLICSRLLRDGCEVLEVHNGRELINLLSALVLKNAELGRVDVVVSDVRMPGFSGLEALRALRRVDPVTPVVLITAFGDASLHEEAWSLGAAVFDKPFDLDDLRTVVLNFRYLPTLTKRIV